MHELLPEEWREEVDRADCMNIYESGRIAMEAGLRGVADPPPRAVRLIEKLDKKRRSKLRPSLT